MDLSDFSVKSLISKEYLALDAEDSLSAYVGKIESWKHAEGLVFDDNDVFKGIISFKGLLRKKIDPSQVKLKKLMVQFPKITEEENIVKVAELMYYSGARLLPVFSGSSFVGVIYAQDIIKQLGKVDDFRKIRAEKLATQKPQCLKESDSFEKALLLMDTARVRKIPIVNKEGRLIGMLLMEDALKRYYSNISAPMQVYGASPQAHFPEKTDLLKVSINRDVSTDYAEITENETLPQILNSFQIDKGIIITKNGVPSGIITAKNLLQLFLRLKKEERNMRISDMPALDEIDKAKAINTINKVYDKLERIIGNKPMIYFYFKQYEKEGPRKKHVIHIRSAIGSKKIVVEKNDWNFLTGLQNACSVFEEALIRQVKKKEYRK
ncbi:MAG: hypothetical protein COT15_00720 [Candidatus Diapherotrites archaeon CG08_land_8_20_14_0_20_34_12]|nr:MAG: hypothetical protein COT15_00720 [Candidatus Diapherotrites archaeon CG08_land_8_20_14_0_20_34_12]